MKRIVLYALFCIFSINALAWGPTGHRVVGQIAERHLNAKAKKKIMELLGQETLALVSTWMDDIRSDSTHMDMSAWHWVTIENGQNYADSKKNPKGDAYMTIERVIAELKSHKLSAQQELEDLKILVHLVGDIHMPLHVGCCDDQGGNKVKIKWFKNETDLHHVWDSDMIDDSRLSYTELADALPAPDKVTVARYQSANVIDWAIESMSYRKLMYEIGDTTPGYATLGYKYTFKAFPVVKLRLTQAGLRLAGILNQIYG